MTPIPVKIREEMANDPFYKTCCLSHLGGCEGRIEWHHCLIYGGRQVQQKFAILPACHKHHAEVSKYNDQFIHVALNRATDSELQSITKAINYFFERDRLNKIYGKK